MDTKVKISSFVSSTLMTNVDPGNQHVKVDKQSRISVNPTIIEFSCLSDLILFTNTYSWG